MKANKATLGRSLDQPDPTIRFYLFHGDNDGTSRGLAEQLLKGLGAEKLGLSSAAVKGDPGLLADEAGAIGLFGGQRALWIEPATEDIVIATDLLLQLPAVESPVIAVAGSLRKASAVLKLAEGHALALSHLSYPLEAREADRLVVELGWTEGLRIAGDIASRVASGANNNEAVIATELAKFALFLGASGAAPRELDHATVDALGVDNGEGNWRGAGDLALDGRIDQLAHELQQLAPGSSEAVPIVRSLQRRLLQLAPLRARIEGGERLDNVMTSMGRSLFWRDKALIQRLLSRWSAARLAQAVERAAQLERHLMLSPVPGEAALGEELLAIARAAQR